MKVDFLNDLNPQQQKAVSFGNGPLLVLAGAGSGKTKALTYRAAWLICQKKIDPSQILLVTFTNKAAMEIKNRIRQILSSNTIPFAGTFHSFCVKILKKEGHHIGIAPNFTIYDAQDQLDLVKVVFVKLGITDFKPASILNAISGAKNELISELEYPQYAKSYFTKTVANVYLLYQRLLKEYNALDFDDLLFKTVKLLETNANLLAKYQDQFKYVLVDEYQDTNRAQYRMTKLLTNSSKNLTVVGDCSQSIYSWRGADYRNILKLQQDYPQLVTINLEQNYRSHQVILDAAFAVISHNKSHPILKLWTKQKKGEKITLYQAKNEQDEAGFVSQKIQKGIDEGKNYQDFGILYRTNAQSRTIEEAFLHFGIPYILVGGTRFYERKEIKDCLAFLRVLSNPDDLISYKRIEKLGKRRLEKFLSFLETKPAGETEKILEDILKNANYYSLFDEHDEADLYRLENIKELFSVAQEFPKLPEFLENVALIEKENLPKNRTKEGPKNAVTLMTLHAAKGLEFDTVFIIGMEESLFPHSRSMLDKFQLEEERRLCYVGITRAKQKLYLTYTSQRLYFGRRNSNDISRFIVDLPENLLKMEYASLLTE